MACFEPCQSINPWNEGDYRIYGYAIKAPDGGYWPTYSIERIQGVPDAPRQVVRLHEVRAQSFLTEALAEMMAVSHGVHRVRMQDHLKH